MLLSTDFLLRSSLFGVGDFLGFYSITFAPLLLLLVLFGLRDVIWSARFHMMGVAPALASKSASMVRLARQ